MIEIDCAAAVYKARTSNGLPTDAQAVGRGTVTVHVIRPGTRINRPRVVQTCSHCSSHLHLHARWLDNQSPCAYQVSGLGAGGQGRRFRCRGMYVSGFTLSKLHGG